MTYWLPVTGPWRWPILGGGGFALILLGLALLFWPAAMASIFYTILGLLLMAYGIERIVSGLRGPYPQLRRRKVIGGTIGLVAGLVAVINPLMGMLLVPGVLFIFIGMAIAINGILQLSQVRLRDPYGQIQHHWGSLVVGIFKIGIAVLIMMNPIGSGLLVLRIIGVWAIIGGAVLIGIGMRMHAAD